MGAAVHGTGRRVRRAVSVTAVVVGCVLFLGGFVLAAVLYQPYRVPTDSMAPAVQPGDRILAHRLDGREVRRGDVVVFRHAEWGDLPMVKRVVGVGGDALTCCDAEGRLTVDGVPLDEPYRDASQPAARQDFDIEVPDDELFLLGDDRFDSVDSRSLITDEDAGTVPRDAVSARVEAVVWPADRWTLLTPAPEYAALPGGNSGAGPLRALLVGTAAGAVLILAGAVLSPWAGRSARSGA